MNFTDINIIYSDSVFLLNRWDSHRLAGDLEALTLNNVASLLEQSSYCVLVITIPVGKWSAVWSWVGWPGNQEQVSRSLTKTYLSHISWQAPVSAIPQLCLLARSSECHDEAVSPGRLRECHEASVASLQFHWSWFLFINPTLHSTTAGGHSGESHAAGHTLVQSHNVKAQSAVNGFSIHGSGVRHKHKKHLYLFF